MGTMNCIHRLMRYSDNLIPIRRSHQLTRSCACHWKLSEIASKFQVRPIYILSKPVHHVLSYFQLNHHRCFRTEAEFHLKADQTLNDLQEGIEDSIEEMEEIVLASGVLTFETPRGTWVLNKQTPNKQIWWSSPISGPKRYEYDNHKDTWVNTRDGSFLQDSLKEEMLEVYGTELTL